MTEILAILLALPGPAPAGEAKPNVMDFACPYQTEGLELRAKPKKHKYVLKGSKDFRVDYPAENPDGTVNAVIEIPAGCIDKWEVDIAGNLKWDRKKKKVRFVKFLGYPGSYGMIPGTRGGDGDPVDVIVLGPPIARGTVAKTRLLGVLKMKDGGEQDDKLIAVPAGKAPNNPFSNAKTLDDLPEGALDIIRLWFANYKGRKIATEGFGDKEEAEGLLRSAAAD